MPSVVLFMLSIALVLTVLGHWSREASRHVRRLEEIAVRIHVNGTRGKSTVTRMVAGLLRESGVRTVAKCTGSAATIIHSDSSESPLHRRAAATILEQVTVIRDCVPGDTEALVVECMALRPDYQAVSETKMIRSHIGIITNVREDHQDVMGRTLPEIARSLLNTCPHDGILVTAEQDPAILAIMRKEANHRGSRLVVADPASVCDEDLSGFNHVVFRDNVAIGLAVAAVLGISRDVAMAGMRKAAPDPGALRLRHWTMRDKRVTWANLFAVNDRESTLAVMELLNPFRTADTLTVGLLNNRRDREERALQFADIAALELDFDRLAALGSYEQVVIDRLVRNGYPTDRIINLGAGRDPTLKEMLDELVFQMPSSHVLLVGMVNIHTRQAEQLLDLFECQEHTARERSITVERAA